MSANMSAHDMTLSRGRKEKENDMKYSFHRKTGSGLKPWGVSTVAVGPAIRRPNLGSSRRRIAVSLRPSQ
jgi:hypothetical protein